MSKTDSVYVSDSISDIIDMDQFYDGPDDMDNISVEIDASSFKSTNILNKAKLYDDFAEIEFTCNCSKASKLMFDPEISRLRF